MNSIVAYTRFINSKRSLTFSGALILTLLSSILLPLSLPNPVFAYGSPFIGIIALIPLYFAIYSQDSIKKISLMGLVFGAVSTALGNFWLAFFQDFSVWTLGGAVLGYMAYNALLFPFLFAGKEKKYRPLWFAIVWTAYELLKSIGFLGYPWGLSAYSVTEIMPLIQIADMFGVYAISFIIVLANSVIAEWLNGIGSNTLRTLPFKQGITAFTAVIICLTWIYGLVSLQRDIPVVATINVVLVQNDGDGWAPGKFWNQLENTQNLTWQAVKDRPAPDLIVWSETILRYPLPDYSIYYQRNPENWPFTNFLQSLPAPLLSGGAYMIDRDNFDMINAALLFNNNAR
ncbi:MAG: apolipoprotein N-acyltransferase, partial [Spirochaetaceae bacterium]